MSIKTQLIITTIFLQPLLGNPWGKDADLAYRRQTYCETSQKAFQSNILSRWGQEMIRFHQNVISPADGPRSHFIPSSSQYALDAIKKYGFFKGVSMGCDRLMRENDDPWVYRKAVTERGGLMKWDPVK